MSKDTYTAGPYTVTVEQDTDPGNPREDRYQIGTMVCFHNRYKLGDEHGMTIAEARAFEKRDDIIALPLYLFDHSGLRMSTNDGDFARWDSHGWDWGKVGFIYVTLEKVRKEYHCKRVTKKIRETIIGCLQGEVNEYDQYLSGDVWTITITRDGEHIETLGGYYGHEYASEEAQNEIDSLLKAEYVENKKFNRAMAI